MRKFLLHVLLLLGATTTIAYSNPSGVETTENLSWCSPTIQFKNTGCETVKVYWKSGNNLYFYKTLTAGSSYHQSTYLNHVWVFKVNGSPIDQYAVSVCDNHTYEIETGGCGGNTGGADCSATPNNLAGLIYMGEYNGSKYYCSDSNYNNWSAATASNAATQFGGHLVVINNAGENEFIRNGIMSNQIWLGFTDSQNEGDFKWVNGDGVNYTNWAYGEPNNQGLSSYNADHSILEKSSGKWKDRHANEQYEFVIEVPCQQTPICTGQLTGVKFYDLEDGSTLDIIDGATYQVNQLPSSYNIEAMVDGNIESVKFTFSGDLSENHTENITPYRYGGDNNPLTLMPGDYTLKVRAFLNDQAAGDICDTRTIHFTVAHDVPTCNAVCQREVSNTTSCGGNGPYTIYLANSQGGNYFDGAGETWEECADGTIHYYGTAHKTQGASDDDFVTFDLYFSGKTTIAPANSPKPNACFSYDESTFVYYMSTSGTITSQNHGTFNVVQTGPVFQLGEGANQQAGGFGASGWMLFYNGSDYYTSGDVNVGLSNTCDVCIGNDFDIVCEKYINDDGWQVDNDCVVKVCEGDRVILSVNPNGLPTTWTGPNGFTADNNDIFIAENVTAANAGNYIATVDKNGCIKSHTIQLKVMDAPDVDVEAIDLSCGETDGMIKFYFEDNASRTNIEFSIDGGNTFTLNVKDDIGSAKFNNLEAGTYEVAVRWGNNECPVDLGSFTLDAPNDEDNDGTCDDEDCAPNDNTLPAAPGTPCDDFDPNTVNDVIQGDGCSCAGVDPCIANDFEIVCEKNLNDGGWQVDGDCKVKVCEGEKVMLSVNPNGLPTTWTGPNGFTGDMNDILVGESVGIADAGYYTATIDNNGCIKTHAIRLIVNVLPDVVVEATDLSCGQEDGSIKFFFGDTGGRTNIEFSLDGGNSFPLNVKDNVGMAAFNNLAAGTYELAVRWGNNECPVDLGSYSLAIPDADEDGVCDDDDCAPNNAAIPATPGTPCDDNNPDTENDMIQDDGCSCVGAPVAPPCINVGLGGFIGFNDCQGDFLYCPLTNPVPPVITNCGDPEGGEGDLEIVWLSSTTSCLPPTTTFANIEDDPHWAVVPDATELSYAPAEISQNTCFLRCVRRAGCETFIESNIISLTIDTECLTFDRFGVSIGDRVWDDLNGDGIQDDGEPGLADVYVNLQDGSGNSIRWTSTDENGEYIFFGLTEGTFQLQFSTPAGYEVTPTGATTDQDKDNNVNQFTGLSEVLNLGSGDHIRSLDAGYRQAGQFLATNSVDFQFETVKGEEHTELFWTHNAGDEVIEYVIERAANGASYEEMSKQASKGGQVAELYVDFDLAPVTGDNLYRVKLTYVDGTTGYSDPILVHFADLIDFTVFPNPASDFVKINLETLVGKAVNIQLISNTGTVIESVQIDEVYGKYYQIDLRNLKEGHYVVWVQSPTHKAVTQQLIIGKP